MKIRLLIVDDVSDTRVKLRKGLEKIDPNYEIFEAKGGKECLEIIKKIKPDIVLMDIVMPDLDGFQTTMSLREDPETRNTLVVFLTVRSDEMSRRIGKMLGKGYLLKPINPSDIDYEIKSVLTDNY
ncbi:MAG: PleD family two-component system response regulator [Candidatus Woesearchaeota archaeon]